MKKITLFALLVLAGMIFAAPALRAQEAEETDAQKKAKAIKAIEDDDQLLNYLRQMDPETLAAYVDAVVQSGDADLIDRLSTALNNMGTDIATAMAGGNAQPAGQPAAGDNGASGDNAGGAGEGDKAAAAASAIAAGFADAGGTIGGSDFFTSNPVANSSSLSRPEAE